MNRLAKRSSGDEGRILLNVRRWRQCTSECAIATVSSLANFYDPSIVYRDVRKLVSTKIRSEGLYTSQQGSLLNKLGFNKVTMVSFNGDVLDWSWRDLEKHKLIDKLKQKRAYCGRIRDLNLKEMVDDLINWLSDEKYENKLVIDFKLGNYIRNHLNKGRPVGASYNWTSLFKQTKSRGEDITGETESHAVVIRGYDDQGVFIVDSNTSRRRASKFMSGYYKLSWEDFLVNTEQGDLILI